MRLIDNLREDVNGVKEEQQGMTESIEKVINFVKRIELLTVEPNGDDLNTTKKSKSSFQSISEVDEEDD